MAQLTLRILNLQKVISKYNKLGNIDITPPIKTATAIVQRRAKELAPYKTGDLQRSIHRKIYRSKGQPYGKVFTNLEYAIYQEFGYTRNIRKGESLFGGARVATKDITVIYAGKPFMRPAMDIEKRNIRKIVESYMRKEFNKIKHGQ